MFSVWSTNYNADEFPVITANENINIQHLPVLTSTELWRDNSETLKSALRDNLIILSLSGHNPRVTVQGLIDMAGERQWRQRKAKVVVRTQDSHHQLRDEIAIIDEIDVMAIAHSNYLKYFPPQKALHVPCSLYYSRSMAKEWLRQTPTGKDIDVVFPFQLYRGEPRNALAYEVLRNLNKRGISARFGFFRYFRNQEAPPLLWEEFARARVILNLPLRDDFNIRNFEASLFPAWHITPKLPDHDLVTMDWSHTRFVESNASNITSAIEEILRSDQKKEFSLAPRESVLHQHTASDRDYQIIDAVLGTTLQKQPKVFDALSEMNKKPPIVTVYEPRQLLANGPTLFSRVPSNAQYKPSLWRRLGSTVLFSFFLLGALRKLLNPSAR